MALLRWLLELEGYVILSTDDLRKEINAPFSVLAQMASYWSGYYYGLEELAILACIWSR